MITWIRQISVRTAGITGLCFYVVTILLHVLIMNGVIPLTWINGGRSAAMAEQLPLSLFNIGIAVFGAAFTLYAMRSASKKGVAALCWFFVVLWTFGFGQQLAGTFFEQTVCSGILLVGIVSNLRLALEGGRSG